jgi:stearoyl-CoA desaturase (delta-9 desaturase)
MTSDGAIAVPPAETLARPGDSGRPWERPWWKPVRGKEGIFAYLVIIHILAVTGVLLFPKPPLPVLAWSVAFVVMGGLGTSVAYHRALAHRTVKLNAAVEQLLIFSAIFNGSGAPANWVAIHRLHHAQSDKPGDVSSPTHGGFWWAHLRWLYQVPRADARRCCPDLFLPRYRFWFYAQVPVLLLSLGCGAVLGWAGFFWMGGIRLVYALHMQCFVNSLTHLGDGEDGDHSRNVWWLGPLQLSAWGENWHRNHHSRPGSARFARHWWQVDIGWYVICALRMIGLAGMSEAQRRAAE